MKKQNLQIVKVFKVDENFDGKQLKELEVKTKSDSEAETAAFHFRNNSLKKSTLSIEFINDFYVEPKDGKPKLHRNLFIYDLKIVGEKPPIPVPESELTSVHRMIVRSTPQSEGSVLKASQTCLQPLASKAYRRPVKKDELDRLAKIVVEATEEGDSYEAALQLALQAILVSPHFLFISFPIHSYFIFIYKYLFCICIRNQRRRRRKKNSHYFKLRTNTYKTLR